MDNPAVFITNLAAIFVFGVITGAAASILVYMLYSLRKPLVAPPSPTTETKA